MRSTAPATALRPVSRSLPYCQSVWSWPNRASVPVSETVTRDLSASRLSASRISPAAPARRHRRLRPRPGAAATEHRQPGEQAALVLEQQVVAPVHHRPERLLAGQGGAGTPGEQPEAVAEPFGQGGQRQRTQTGGGELNGQGQVVEPAADVLDDLASLPVGQEAGSHGPGAVGEQLDCGRRVQPAYGHQVFAGECRAAPGWWRSAGGRAPLPPGFRPAPPPQRHYSTASVSVALVPPPDRA